MVVLYRCMCSKHYAEWRTSWKSSAGLESNRNGYSESTADANLVMETFPMKLHGHSQELEYICADSNVVISSCLDGNINVWDSISGECLTSIRRSRFFESAKRKTVHSRSNGSFSSDSTYSSSPQSDNGEYMSQHKTSNSVNFLPQQSESVCNFPKHFTFDKTSHSAVDHCMRGQKYDFSRFALSEDSPPSEMIVEDVHSLNDCHNIAHEFQQYKDSNYEYTDKGTKIVHSTLNPQAVWSIDHYGSCIAVGCREGR
ncbi:Sterol regulatory element-binding protein cleavage-activating protein, partial [Stegodyphus mimosarum]